MPRMVFCKRLDREAEGLDEPPFFGKVGKEIFDNVSKEAWAEWEDLQLKILNEYRLDLADKEHRKVLTQQMRLFFGLDESGEKSLDVGTPTY